MKIKPREYLPVLLFILILVLVVVRLFVVGDTDWLEDIIEAMIVLLGMVFGFYFRANGEKKTM